MKNRKGFTLIELLIVIAIIALLATLAIISLTTAQRKARDTKRLADVKSIQSSVELYYSDNASYPAADTSFATTVSGYMQVPNPPNTDSPYIYGTGNDIYVVSCDLEENDHDAMQNSGPNTFDCDGSGNACVQWTNAGTYTSSAADILCGNTTTGIYCAEG